MYFKLILEGAAVVFGGRRQAKKNDVLVNCVQAFAGGHFKRLSISLYEIFSSHNEKKF
jgi:hypothetical protein